MSAPPHRRVLITGAARGQGRSHALRFAAQGADVVLTDICGPISSVRAYPLATPEDLHESAALVTAAGGRALTMVADVRSAQAMEDVVATAVASFGGLDVVVANAGIAVYGRTWELTEPEWRDVLDTDLTGAWHTVRAALEPLRRSPSASVVVTSSLCGVRGVPYLAAYVAAKHGLLGMVGALAEILRGTDIRFNAVCPGAVDAPPGRLSTGVPTAFTGPDFGRFFEPALPVELLATADVTDAVAWLASPNCPLNGVALPVDAGASGR